MKDLETMQREEREALKKDFNNLYQKEYTTDFKEKRLIRNTEIDIMSLDNLDQHTANTWKAAQESMIDSMKNTTIDTYEISGEQYFKKADVRKLIKGEPFSVESSPKSDNRFDVPVNIGFK